MKIQSTLLLFILLACTQTFNDKKDVYGSWRTVEDQKFANDGLMDSIIFNKPNVCKTYIIENGVKVDSTTGNFTLDMRDSTLITKFGNYTTHFKILQLTNAILFARNLDKKYTLKLHRL